MTVDGGEERRRGDDTDSHHPEHAAELPPRQRRHDVVAHVAAHVAAYLITGGAVKIQRTFVAQKACQHGRSAW
ncbi:hypothetical protein FsymDg_2690 [Candidatus Protofrankia datiscae]|uniref:Uncharacterized protein n=1 Tax=Candidatus Protofrankia datiscae TaxID=2716812 RepID=F8B423_9ACTN|nr:hypothetical protein [Candidatus Protofrankia datiscae]AEH10040.1 hypothetical protein FsymDg_2690 [Candidatus Protofrankia datiscae]